MTEMTEIELLGKILLSVRFIRYTLFIFIGLHIGRMLVGLCIGLLPLRQNKVKEKSK